MKIELSWDEFWLVHNAIEKRIETFREHIEHLQECAKEIETGGTVVLLGSGERGARVVRETIENFEAQIRKHKWMLDVKFNAGLYDDEDEEADE